MKATLIRLSALTLGLHAAASFAATCNPLGTNTCAVPFPSDVWAVTDTSSPTGKRLQFTDDVLRAELLAQLPADDGFTPSQLFADASGFSAASAVVFELSAALELERLAADGAGQVVAFDLTAGEPVDIRVQSSDYAKGENVSAAREMLEIYPLDRWPFGHEIVVIVTQQLPVATQPDFATRIASADPATQSYVQSLSAALNSAGVNSADVMMATRFTVRAQADVVAPMQEIVARTWEGDHAVRNIEVDYNSYTSNNVAVVTGELRTDNYRTRNGTGRLDFNKAPTDQWIEFKLSIPKAAIDRSVPVAFYAHGLGGAKWMDLVVTGMNADLGVATFSVDFPNHGARAEVDGGAIFSLLEIDKLPSVIGMVQHNAIDFAAAHKALTTLADLDVVKRRASWFSCWKCADGTPDIDPTRVFMQGTSLGGVLGSAYGALAPELRGGMYQVTGVGITSILSNSVLWDGVFSNLMPPAANGAEALMLRGAVQQVLDYGDSINYIELFREPANGQGARPLLVLSGAGDNVVPNPSSVALARIVELPLVGEALYPMPGVTHVQEYGQDGYGVRHYPPVLFDLGWLFGGLITDATGHGIFLLSDAVEDQADWIERFILN